jgi:LmbE family N-acetylglucosaminyl deacetylase
LTTNTDFITRLLGDSPPQSLRCLDLPQSLRLLALGPHPDDFDVNAVTLRLFKENGNSIHVGVVRVGSGVEDSYCSSPTLQAKAALREKEQRDSCQFFGLPDSCLTFLDLDLNEKAQTKENPQNLRRLRDFILSIRPDIVFLPHGNDTNTGHQRMYSMFRRIAVEANHPLVAFLNLDPKTIGMHTDIFTEFGKEEAEWKARMLRFHDSQHQRNLNTRGHGFDDRILRVNSQIARELGIDAAYAEAFELEFFGLQ